MISFIFFLGLFDWLLFLIFDENGWTLIEWMDLWFEFEAFPFPFVVVDLWMRTIFPGQLIVAMQQCVQDLDRSWIDRWEIMIMEGIVGLNMSFFFQLFIIPVTLCQFFLHFPFNYNWKTVSQAFNWIELWNV